MCKSSAPGTRSNKRIQPSLCGSQQPSPTPRSPRFFFAVPERRGAAAVCLQGRSYRYHHPHAATTTPEGHNSTVHRPIPDHRPIPAPAASSQPVFGEVLHWRLGALFWAAIDGPSQSQERAGRREKWLGVAHNPLSPTYGGLGPPRPSLALAPGAWIRFFPTGLLFVMG